MSKICLVIIFNHRFDVNIEKLEKLYEGRFSHIYHIVPFYDGDKENVIPVYECSFRFNGYIAQAYEKFKGDYDHYFFVADDIALHPDINERNFEEWFGVDADTCYIPELKPIRELEGWGFSQNFMDPEHFLVFYTGTNWKSEMMSADEAFKIAEAKGYKKSDFSFGVSEMKNCLKYRKRYPRVITLFFKTIIKGRQQLPYPVWGKYCDIFSIPGGQMKDMARMFGVTAAMNFYVEMAIPTTLMLLSPKVSFGEGRKEKPLLLWGKQARGEIVDKYHGDFNYLEENWDENTLFIHPIKLSQWTGRFD